MLARTTLSVACLTAAIGCASTTSVAPGTQPAIEPGHGLVILVVDTDTPLESLTFYNGERAVDIRVPRADRGVSEHLFVAPPGVYRLTNYRGPHAIYDAAAAGQRSVCLQVEAGAVTDPGQFQHRATGKGDGWRNFVNHRFRPDAADTKARLSEMWPAIAAEHSLRATSCGP